MTIDKKKCILCIHDKTILRSIGYLIYHCGDVSGEVPPVLIPNTEVKLTSAENTLLETARENRLLLHPIKKRTTCNKWFFFRCKQQPFPIPPTASLLGKLLKSRGNSFSKPFPLNNPLYKLFLYRKNIKPTNLMLVGLIFYT